MRTSNSKYVREVRNGCELLQQNWSEYQSVSSASVARYVLGGQAFILQGFSVLMGRSDQLHSYSETVGSDWSGRYTE
jgi:hypothetical protein